MPEEIHDEKHKLLQGNDRYGKREHARVAPAYAEKAFLRLRLALRKEEISEQKKQKKEVGGTLLRFPPCPLSALKLHKFSFNN